MKSVLISTQPRWCKLIASGKKRIEVRKTKPKIEVPFKAYIYCTKGDPVFTQSAFCDEVSNGKVIGEFVCDSVDDIPYITSAVEGTMIPRYVGNNESHTCLSEIDIFKYGRGNLLYGWHISDLVIYDKPKELSGFATVCEGLKPYQCDKCEYSYTESNESIGVYHECCCNNLKPLKRPPQSWCYVKKGADHERKID